MSGVSVCTAKAQIVLDRLVGSAAAVVVGRRLIVFSSKIIARELASGGRVPTTALSVIVLPSRTTSIGDTRPRLAGDDVGQRLAASHPCR